MHLLEVFSRLNETKSLAGANGDKIHIGDAYIDINTAPTYAPRPQSVIDFVVPEDLRGTGIGTQLLRKAVAKYPDLGGQVSSLASLKVFYNLGFRNPGMPDGTFDDHVNQYKEYSSIFMAHTDAEGKSYISESISESREPACVYRIVDKGELIHALEVGYLVPSAFYGRIHASFSPELQYGKAGDRVLKIKYDIADGWKEKQGDKIYLTTDQPVSLDKVDIIDTIGGDSPLFQFNDQPYTGLDSINGDIAITSGYDTDIFPKVYNAKYYQLLDSTGLLAYAFKWNNETYLAYRSKTGIRYTTDIESFIDELTQYNDISISKKGKFIRKLVEYTVLSEKSVSKKQQRFMGMVHAAQQGKTPASKEIAKVAKSMGKQDVTDFAKTKHATLPEAIDDELATLRKLAGITDRQSPNMLTQSDNSVKKRQYESTNNILPGTDAWFRLHFAQPHLTGELPYDGYNDN